MIERPAKLLVHSLDTARYIIKAMEMIDSTHASQFHLLSALQQALMTAEEARQMLVKQLTTAGVPPNSS